jgi:formamidopyrimidine-DNA glycosylase
MPELPELEVVREVLARRLTGRRIEQVTVAPKGGPILIRDLTGQGFATLLTGSLIESVSRRGKFLLFSLRPADASALSPTLAVNPKLAGRFQLCPPGAKKAGPVHVSFLFADPGQELRYVDHKRMGQLYLTWDLAAVPDFSEMGPEALEVSLEDFSRRLASFRGEIKGILIRSTFVAGIGNAYADEILWQAMIHPYRKRTSLSPDETERLYQAMQATLREAITKVRQEMGEDIHTEPRTFLAVHLRTGQPCPRCGESITSITANQRLTSFCRTCQPGGLIRGM